MKYQKPKMTDVNKDIVYGSLWLIGPRIPCPGL